MKRLEYDFYKRDGLTVAQDLLGKLIIRKINNKTLIAKIVETESYLGTSDSASHTYAGLKTKRNSTMYMRAGHMYVYLSYGIHNLINIVNGKEDGQAVLIRAIEPMSNLDDFSRLRYGLAYEDLSKYQRDNMTNGPGKLSQALAIDLKDDKTDLLSSDEIYLADGGHKPDCILKSPRIGIDSAQEAKDYEYRFYIKDNKYVSR